MAYETDRAGNFDAYLHRISTSETFTETLAAEGQYLNDVFGDKVAYVDMRNGPEAILLHNLSLSEMIRVPFCAAIPMVTVSVMPTTIVQLPPIPTRQTPMAMQSVMPVMWRRT